MDNGKVAIITGGSRGIGRSAALQLAQRGVGVILSFKSNAGAAEAVVNEIKKSGGRAAALKLDLTDIQSFDDFAKKVLQTLEQTWNRKTFDYLVNNGGSAQRTPIANTTEEEFDKLTKEHFKGPFFLTQKLLPLMTDGGHLINISSALTRHTHNAGVATYAALKSALEVMTYYVAHEFSPRRIRANVVAPGALDTEFGGGRTDQVRKMIAERTMLGRIGEADDIGPLIASLLSDDNRWVNAQRIEATGGLLL
jgi:NAD(P)-dependent dehydrogenase (short-subunit alcohol dehydrogenase family)